MIFNQGARLFGVEKAILSSGSGGNSSTQMQKKDVRPLPYAINKIKPKWIRNLNKHKG